jgi:hypothetical protein
MKKLWSILVLMCLIALTGCNAENHDEALGFINENFGKYINKSSEQPVAFSESNFKDDNFFHISLEVNEKFNNLNLLNKYKELEKLATALESFLEDSNHPYYKFIHLNKVDSVKGDSMTMNIFGEKEINYDTYEHWMVQYYDDNGNAVYYDQNLK